MDGRGVDKVVQAAGSQRKLARVLKEHGIEVTQQAVSAWVQKGYVPARHVLKLEEITGVCRTELNPGEFGISDPEPIEIPLPELKKEEKPSRAKRSWLPPTQIG